MSAFVVDKDHVDAMVTLALRGPAGHWGPGGAWSRLSWICDPDAHWSQCMRQADYSAADDIGVMLWTENVRSIHARYPDTAEADNGAPAYPGPADFGIADIAAYRWERTEQLSAIHGLGILRCYEYQSCEHDGWESSEAYRFCNALRHALINKLPGMDEAPWEYTRPERRASA